jgi:hypothetical protein
MLTCYIQGQFSKEFFRLLPVNFTTYPSGKEVEPDESVGYRSRGRAKKATIKEEGN